LSNNSIEVLIEKFEENKNDNAEKIIHWCKKNYKREVFDFIIERISDVNEERLIRIKFIQRTYSILKPHNLQDDSMAVFLETLSNILDHNHNSVKDMEEYYRFELQNHTIRALKEIKDDNTDVFKIIESHLNYFSNQVNDHIIYQQNLIIDTLIELDANKILSKIIDICLNAPNIEIRKHGMQKLKHVCNNNISWEEIDPYIRKNIDKFKAEKNSDIRNLFIAILRKCKGKFYENHLIDFVRNEKEYSNRKNSIMALSRVASKKGIRILYAIGSSDPDYKDTVNTALEQIRSRKIHYNNIQDMLKETILPSFSVYKIITTIGSIVLPIVTMLISYFGLVQNKPIFGISINNLGWILGILSSIYFAFVLIFGIIILEKSIKLNKSMKYFKIN